MHGHFHTWEHSPDSLGSRRWNFTQNVDKTPSSTRRSGTMGFAVSARLLCVLSFRPTTVSQSRLKISYGLGGGWVGVDGMGGGAGGGEGGNSNGAKL